MARTSSAAVKVAIETTLSPEQVAAFVDDASAWVDQYLADKDLSTAVLTAIEKYLACHFVTLRDPRLKSATLDDVQETYQRDANVTEYLKMAASMDPTGTIEERLMGKRSVKFYVGAGYDTDGGPP